MSSSSRIYPSKLILFGEYTVLNGGKALAIPLKNQYSKWLTNKLEQQQDDHLSALIKFGNHASQLLGDIFDHERFNTDVENGIYLWSNIPIGYGMGSSGSVCAAFFDRYCNKEHFKSLREELSVLAQLESYFHGKSSGMDPIVSFHQMAILKDDDVLEKVQWQDQGFNEPIFFLLDSTQSRSTAHLVAHYKQQCKNDEFVKAFVDPAKRIVNELIDQMLHYIKDDFLATYKHLSTLQFEHMAPMIIESVKKPWLEGLESDQYYLKLCGAGGGGYYLGVTKDVDSIRELSAQFNLIYV